jgi:hypothetical protein
MIPERLISSRTGAPLLGYTVREAAEFKKELKFWVPKLNIQYLPRPIYQPREATGIAAAISKSQARQLSRRREISL